MKLDSSSKTLDKCGIYIHVPVCRGKCIYCSFYSLGHTRNFNWHTFVDAIIAEYKNRQSERDGKTISTIYIGGGTPSLMPSSELSRLLAVIGVERCEQKQVPNIAVERCEQKQVPNIAVERCEQSEALEITLEVNPDDVTPQLAWEWKEAGINRISMGVQSLNDRELKFIGRRHSAAQAIKAFRILRSYFSNISLDLIFGLPGQTLESLKDTLDKFIALRPEHISAYSLMYEERSAIIKMLERGSIMETPEDISVDMFKLINTTLSEAGYNRYEISNYSLPGYHSRHNSSYWDATPYIGLGPSAHSYNGDRIRKFNMPDLREYMTPTKLGNPSYESEILSEDELREEILMTRLRVTKGLELKSFDNRFGTNASQELMSKAQKHLKCGNLIVTDGHLRLTDNGVMISDDIIIDLF